MLSVVDPVAYWNERIIEKLYLQTGGQVDKPFPAVGDLLCIYLLEGRLYPGSPQNWFIVFAKRLQKPAPKSQNFWCQCDFNPDILPLPDIAVPWRKAFDPWVLRDKVTSRPTWIRLNTDEKHGCSYYNLSDWIKTKRSIYDAVKVPPTPLKKPKRNHTNKTLRTPASTRRNRRRCVRNKDEYLYAESESSSDSDVEFPDEPITVGTMHTSSWLPTLLTTGKMSSGDTISMSTTANSSLSSTPRTKRKTAEVVIGYPMWAPLREETQQTILSVIIGKNAELAEEVWLAPLVQQIEEEAIFEKSGLNQDRYEGVCRAVLGIIQRFDCFADAVETLVTVSEDLREDLLNTSGSLPDLGATFSHQ
jgi:hypothetical protein